MTVQFFGGRESRGKRLSDRPYQPNMGLVISISGDIDRSVQEIERDEGAFLNERLSRPNQAPVYRGKV